MTTRNWLRRGAPVLALVAGLSACSSSGGDSSAPPSSDSTSAAAATSGGSSSAPAAAGSAVKIGLICSCTGPYGANLIPAVDVAKAWASSVNDAGGVAGHSIEIEYVDDKADPGAAATVAQELISKKVAAVIDASYMSGVWATPISQAKIPVIGGQLQAADYITNPDFFPTGQTADTSVPSVAAIAKQAGASKLATLYCAEAPQCKQAADVMKQVGQAAGVPQIYQASIAATGANYTAQCLAAKQSGSDAVFFLGSEATGRRLAADCNRQGYNPAYVMLGSGYADSLSSDPAMSKNLWVTFATLPYWADAPAQQKMRDAMDKYFPGVRAGKDKSAVWSQVATQSWTAGKMLEKAITNSGVAGAGSVDSAAVVKGLYAVKDETLDGLTSPVNYAQGKPNPVRCFFTGHISGGKPELENGGKPTCLPAA